MSYLMTFIIPVYNVENYLSQSIESIINQNLSSFEIILIDDGSTDKSPLICDSYALKYSNINVIHTKNRGQSAARNTGVLHSKGKYILFLDSDDYYKENSLNLFEQEVLLNPNIDLLTGKILIFYEGNENVHPKTSYKDINVINGMTGENAFKYLVNTNQFLVSPYSYMIRRDVLITNNIFFDESLRCAEDILFTPQVYFNCKTVSSLDIFFLMYRKNREGQITHSITLQKKESVLMTLDKSIKDGQNYQIGNETKNVFYRFISTLYITSLGKINNFKKHDRKKGIKLLYKYKHLIKYSGGKRYTIPKYIYYIFGFKTYLLTISIMRRSYKFFKDVH